MSRYLPVAAAVVLIVATAILQGWWTERWGSFPELELYAQQLKKVPSQIGDWVGEDTPETDENKRVLELAGAVGSLSRVYRNERNEQVSVFIVCGRLDDVFFHTPDRCYPAAGFETSGDVAKQSVEIGSEVADFKSAMFLKADPNGSQNLRIYWSFNANGPWIAPDEYRWSFQGQRAIYKIYVVTPANTRDVPVDQNAAIDFIRVLMPELNKAFEPAFANAENADDQTSKSAGATPSENKS